MLIFQPTLNAFSIFYLQIPPVLLLSDKKKKQLYVINKINTTVEIHLVNLVQHSFIPFRKKNPISGIVADEKHALSINIITSIVKFTSGQILPNQAIPFSRPCGAFRRSQKRLFSLFSPPIYRPRDL
jgi:hypothetical protein